MRTDLLSRTGSVVFDATGTGTVTLRPDVGEWWTPTLTRVSTINQTGTSYAAVYHGAVSDISPSAFIDDTFQGQGDSSSMVSGTVVAFGEGITAKWIGGVPGDTGILVLNGLSSDTPPALGYSIPTTPGAHFRGNLTAESITSLAKIPRATPLPVIPAVPYQNGPFDVHVFATYYLEMFAVTSGAATGYNPCKVLLSWYSTPQALSDNLLYQDEAEWFADTNSGGFQVFHQDLELQDQMHGPYLFIQFFNESPTNDTVNLSYNLQASSRAIGQPYWRQHDSIDGTIEFLPVTALANGQSVTIPCSFTYGRISQRIAAGAGGLGVNISYGTLGVADSFNLVANTALMKEIIVPKRALSINIFNGSGVASSYTVQLFTLFDKV